MKFRTDFMFLFIYKYPKYSTIDTSYLVIKTLNFKVMVTFVIQFSPAISWSLAGGKRVSSLLLADPLI